MNPIDDAPEDPLGDTVLVDTLLREHFANDSPPDLVSAVRRRRSNANDAARRLAQAPSVRPNLRIERRWLAAAMVLLGLGVVLGTSVFCREAPPTPAPAQEPTIVPVADFAQFQALLTGVVSITIQPKWTTREAIPLTAAKPWRSNDAGHVRGLVARLGQPAVLAGQAQFVARQWVHLEFEDRRALALFLSPDAPRSKGNLMQVRGMTECLDVSEGTAGFLRMLIAQAEQKACRELGIVRDGAELSGVEPSLALPTTTTHLSLHGVPEANLRYLRRFPALASIDVSGIADGLTAAGMREIAAVPTLQEFTCHGFRLDDSTLRELGEHEQLRSLVLDGATALTGQAFLQVVVGPGRVAPFQRLERLHLCDVATLEAFALPNVAALPALRELHLRDTPLPNDDKRWYTFVHASKFEVLDLGGHDWSETRLRAIAGIRTLRELGLMRCEMDDRDLEALAAAATALRRLDLAANPITDAGVAQLVKMSALAEVNLACCDEVSAGAVETLTRRAPPVRVLLGP